jgi:sugar phosphate isomerase/epimerase
VYKNFSPLGLGISGRQSELIELAMTYGFRGLDIDMDETQRRAARSSADEAGKYFKAAKRASTQYALHLVGYACNLNFDVDAAGWGNEIGKAKVTAQLANNFGLEQVYVTIPSGSDRLAYHEFFDETQQRLRQLAELLQGENIRLVLNFDPGAPAIEKQFPFVRTVEAFLAMVKGVGSKNIGIVVDSWNWHVGEGGLDQLSDVAVDTIAAVRLADLPENIDRSEAKSVDRLLPTAQNIVNNVGVLQYLKRQEYTGPISIYCHGDKVRGMTREVIVVKAQEAIDALFTAADIPVPPRPADMIDHQAALEPLDLGIGMDRDSDY